MQNEINVIIAIFFVMNKIAMDSTVLTIGSVFWIRTFPKNVGLRPSVH